MPMSYWTRYQRAATEAEEPPVQVKTCSVYAQPCVDEKGCDETRRCLEKEPF
jgi:hypothetical protein